MDSDLKLAFKALALTGLVLLPFLAHYILTPEERYPTGPRAIAELIDQGRYDQAYRLLLHQEQSGWKDPDERRRAEFQMAICERWLKRPARAYSRLAQLENALPELEDYRRFWMARALEEMDEREGAMAAYRDLLLLSQHEQIAELASLRLGALYLEVEEYEQAATLYRELLERAPQQKAEVLYRLGQVHDLLDEREESHRYWQQLVEDHPATQRALEAVAQLPNDDSATALYACAQVYFEHERYSQTIRQFRKFLRVYPRHRLAEEAHYVLGRAYAAEGQYERAQQTFQEIYDTYGRPSALFRIGGLQVRRDLETEALRTYVKFVRLYPRHELADEALWQAAKAAERNDHFERAEQFYRRIAENYPDSDHRDEAGWSIGFMFYCGGDYRKALVVFRRLSEMAREPHIVDQSLFWAGKAADRLGFADQARSYYRGAARGFPRSYYSARAFALGYREEVPLTPRPPMLLRPHPDTEAQLVRGVDYLRRADALHYLGLDSLAERELQHAERLNDDRLDALRLIRDRYETFGLLDRAMRLSTRIFVSDGSQSEIYRIYPNYYWEQIVKAAGEAEVDPYLVLSVIRQESSFKKDAVSKAGALGLMQLMPQTGRTLARNLGISRFERRSLLEAETSIRLGSHFLGDQVHQFTDGPYQELEFELGLAAYNAGPQNAHRWLERIPYEDPDTFVERIPYHETRLYVKLVLKNYTIYKALSDV